MRLLRQPHVNQTFGALLSAPTKHEGQHNSLGHDVGGPAKGRQGTIHGTTSGLPGARLARAFRKHNVICV
jgi:hypothetical protein